MIDFLFMINFLAAVSGTPEANFSNYVSQFSNNEQTILLNAGVDTWPEFFNYMDNHGEDNDGIGACESINDIEAHLSSNYPNYYWLKDPSSSGYTSDVSGSTPREMQTPYCYRDEISEAIQNSSAVGTYGGCGPIAGIGMLDYFAKYLGFSEIIEDTSNYYQKVQLATDVLNEMNVMNVNDEEILTWPWEYRKALNNLLEDYGVDNYITVENQNRLFKSNNDDFWDIVVNNVNNGIPVTFAKGKDRDAGDFAGHYTNIYGYETWVGFPNNGGSTLEKRFIKARKNWGDDTDAFCSADALKTKQVSLITYKLNYNQGYSFYDHDFAEEFVNENGGGQYFFYNKSSQVTLSNNRTIQTERLRCSFIENNYLVLSPKRTGAGTAYLDIQFSHCVPKISFDASLWSSSEGINNQTFSIQYMRPDGYWQSYISYDLNDFKTNKDLKKTYKVLMPKDVTRIRFYSSTPQPESDRNKGRIVLDNFAVNYH